MGSDGGKIARLRSTKKVIVVCCTLHSIKSGLTQESAFQNQVKSI